MRAVGYGSGDSAGGADYMAMRERPETERRASSAVAIPGNPHLHRTSYGGDDNPEQLEPSASLQRQTVPADEVYELIFDGETVTI